MKYLIRANKVVFSGNKEMIVKYMSDFYKSESKQWLDKDGNCIDFGKFKNIIGSMGYEIRDKIPSNCRCEGTSVSIADAPKEVSLSVSLPQRAFAVIPLKASEPPHLYPTISLSEDTVVLLKVTA